ncbi:MAG: fused MFS/spermidine synthase [Bacteroidota bacterium]
MSPHKKAPVWHLYMVSFIEGGALMAVELIGAKLITPFYGNSIYVWASVLGFTLGGLVIGYFVGGRFSARSPSRATLYKIVIASGILVALLPLVAPLILAMTSGMEFRLAILLSAMLILLPSIILFGMVSPMVIRLLTQRLEEVGRSAGTIYGVSTLGGILLNFTMGLLLIPFLGLRFSALLTSALLIGLPLIFLLTGRGNASVPDPQSKKA